MMMTLGESTTWDGRLWNSDPSAPEWFDGHFDDYISAGFMPGQQP